MTALEHRPILRSTAFGWSMLALLPVLVFLFFTVSVGVATLAVLSVLLLVVVLATVMLIRRKLASQRHERELLSSGPTQ